MKKFFLILCFSTVKILHAQNCDPPAAYDSLDINNVNARINNGGDMWCDLIHSPKYFVPQTANASSIGTGALWIGGLDAQGNLHVAAQTFRQNGNDFFPGPLDSGGNVTQQTCSDFDRIWKVNMSTIDSFTAGLFATPPATIEEWPGKGNPNLSFLPNQSLAPFVDVNGDSVFNPANGDYPDIPGDQALWFVINDVGNIHGSGGAPLGIEVQCLFYAANDPACIYSTTFYHYCVINKSQNDYDSVFIGLFADAGFGNYLDDYMGTDSANHLGVFYNGDTAGIGPVIAIQILEGPMDDAGVIHYLDHSMIYYNDFSVIGNPEIAQDYYQYLQSIWKDGTHLTYGGNGQGGLTNSNYVFSGDPSNPNGWSMCSTNAPFSDRRIIVSSGPFSLHSGQTKTFDAAVVWDNTSIYPCPSFTTIDSVASCAKNYFDNNVSLCGIRNVSSRQQSATVFPNPVAASSVINFSPKESSRTGKNFSRVEIFDLAGRKLFASETNENAILKVNSDRLGKGLFIYRITFNDHSSQAGKLVVQ
ncbi:MAG TPA: T9SS type A sorting domain-containing protein [Chitinophagales bacterium]|nr:T9SS type A sorting domain-containing protein [Chitinophagales bacterium]